MEGIFDFVINNAVIIIAISFIIVMAIVGYIVEINGLNAKSELKEDFEIENSIVDDIGHEKKIDDSKEDTDIKKDEDKVDVDEVDDNLEEKEEPEKGESPKKENLNIDKDFSKLLDDEEIIVGNTDDSTLNDIDDDLWKF